MNGAIGMGSMGNYLVPQISEIHGVDEDVSSPVAL